MLSYDQIFEQSKAYANYTVEAIEQMETEELHENLSMRLVAEGEVSSSKKALSSSATELLKRIRGDITCLNHEIRKRVHSVPRAREEEVYVTLEALPESRIVAHVI